MGGYKVVTYLQKPSNFKQTVRTMIFAEILEGMALTLKYMFTKPITLRYPENKWIMPERMKGPVALVRDPEHPDIDLCVGCGLCLRICPSGKALYMESTLGPDNKKIIDNYYYNVLRCIFCGLCVEVCPVGALINTNEYENSQYTREALFFDKESLLKAGSAQRKYVKLLEKKKIKQQTVAVFRRAKWTNQKLDITPREFANTKKVEFTKV